MHKDGISIYINKKRLNKLGYSDFSGSGVVFYAAGIAALIATKLLRPRDYRLN